MRVMCSDIKWDCDPNDAPSTIITLEVPDDVVAQVYDTHVLYIGPILKDFAFARLQEDYSVDIVDMFVAMTN